MIGPLAPDATGRERAVVQSIVEERSHLELRGDWVRYLVHDLRHSLSIVTAYLELLRMRMPSADEDTNTAFTRSSYELKRIEAMAQDLLDLDRIRRGALVPRRLRADARSIAHRVATDQRPFAEGIGVAVVERGGPAECELDEQLIERVVTNLARNAVRFARSAVHIDVDASPGWVSVKVANDGSGIDPRFRDSIFEPFVRLDGSAVGGGGLGLAFCRLVVDAHHGELVLESGDDGHVCFAMRLPCA